MMIQPAGDVIVNFSRSGLLGNISEGSDCARINWREGTIDFKDLLGYMFKVDAQSQTEILTPITETVPEIGFGGRLLKTSFKDNQVKIPKGNIPDLYLISPSGQEGCQLNTDLGILQHYQNNRQNFYRTNEILGVANSVTYSVVSQIQPAQLEAPIIQYKQHTGYPLVPHEVKDTIIQRYRDFTTEVQLRDKESPLADLGESNGTFIDPNGFTYGADREATRLAIIMNYMEQEQLETNTGINSNDNIERLLKQAKAAKSKVGQNTASLKPPPESLAAKKISKYVRRESGIKNTKYFDSPEGIAFLQSQPVFLFHCSNCPLVFLSQCCSKTKTT
jgi:hypothetical protein